jgi:hypothetical protein
MMARIQVLRTIVLAVATGLVFEQPEAAFDDLRQSPRVGALRIPLTSYERIPIGTVLAHPDRYQMREIRLAGSVTSIRTELITNRMICGRAHERTTLVVEDESGQIEILDQGACGKNIGALKAPMLKTGQRIDLLVQIMLPTSLGTPGSSVEATIRYIDLARP